MSHSTDYVVKRLQEVLAREAASTYPDTVLQEEIASYIRQLTQVIDWEEDFLANVYELYLRKITETGNKLCDNITDQQCDNQHI